MRKILTRVLQGLLALLPLSVTLYAVYWLTTTLETLCRQVLTYLLPNAWYFPGFGLILGLAVLITLGLLINIYVFRYLVTLVDRLVQKIPLVKSVYAAINDIITVFNIGKNSDMGAVVSVDMGNGFYQIGFLTGVHAGEKLYPGEDRVGVYLPMSYQIGGFTMYVQRDRITTLDIGVEEAMRLALTGGAQSAPRQ